MQVTEIFNFSQDDLLTEDMMVLDTHSEVFVWMGQCVETKDKQKAFEIGEVRYQVLTFLFFSFLTVVQLLAMTTSLPEICRTCSGL